MILITGGAGYIGSQVNKYLTKAGHQTAVFDNLVKGHRELVKWGEFVKGDLANIDEIRNLFNKYKIEAVMHFAAFIEVDESVKDPEKYYFNNVANTLNLLKVMREFGVNRIIFSSTAATYGNPQYVPMDEKHPQVPINTYGKTKLVIENIFKDYEVAYGLKYVVFRYFNACGADKEAETGEWHSPESHLIPNILKVASGEKESFKLFGTDFPTPDGTCIRDYIHVEDIAEAHLLGLKHLMDGKESKFYNLGSGMGYSNREVIEAVKKVTGKEIKVIESPRREGDAPKLLASSEKIKNEWGWEPEHKNLEEIIKTAWEWEKKKGK
jgi:UDP-glucose 4-epimerase